MLVLLLACTHGATVALDDTGGHDLDTSIDDTSSTAFEGDQAGECADGADNDQDGFFDCEDPDCGGAPDCQVVDTGDSSVDTGDSGDSDGDTDTGDTAVEPVCDPGWATDLVGLTATCDRVDGWTVTVQGDAEAHDLWIQFADWSESGDVNVSSYDSRDGTLRLSSDCCNVVSDKTFGCSDINLQIYVCLLDETGANCIGATTIGPAAGSWPEWTGPDADCPPGP